MFVCSKSHSSCPRERARALDHPIVQQERWNFIPVGAVSMSGVEQTAVIAPSTIEGAYYF
jgi:hypothetical protein